MIRYNIHSTIVSLVNYTLLNICMYELLIILILIKSSQSISHFYKYLVYVCIHPRENDK